MAKRTPKGVALTSSALITGLLALTYFVLIYFLDREFEWQWLLLFVALSVVISYFIVFHLQVVTELLKVYLYISLT
jgi:hypothetical protein